MSEWHKINSAPRDGSRILVYNPAVGVYSSNFEEGEFPLRYWDYEGIWFPKPTHWMPLPASPQPEKPA